MNELNEAIWRQPRLPRFLCHIYQRLKQERLNLVVGAGISVEAGVPGWQGLLDRLAEGGKHLSGDLEQHRSAGLSPEYIGQIIYHRFRDACMTSASEESHTIAVEYDWGEAIQKAIYRGVDESIVEVVAKHPYLAQLRDLVRKVSLVINFNFDDILSDAVGDQIKSGVSGNAMNVTWNPPLVDRKQHTTIYHVNGILPRVSLKKRSPQLIFTEDSFADAIARSPSISSEYIFLRFVQNTMLLIGTSLADSSLKNYLRLNRSRSPANHHYMIYWISANGVMSDTQQRDVFEANLELYNLITIFLTSREIYFVLQLLNQNERNFRDQLDTLGEDRRSRYHYYIVGPVAAGKSTLLEQLRCFHTQEEWTRPPPPEMYLASDKINSDQQQLVDSFIYSEIKEKNKRMHGAPVGFHFMDRAPLDLYAFSKSTSENPEKSYRLRQLVTRDLRLQQGEILFLEAKPETLVRRNLARGRPPEDAGREEYFHSQTEALKDIYYPKFSLSTDKVDAGEAAKKVVRHALFDDYHPTDLDGIIARYE